MGAVKLNKQPTLYLSEGYGGVPLSETPEVLSAGQVSPWMIGSRFSVAVWCDYHLVGKDLPKVAVLR